MPSIGPVELIIVLVIALIILGPSRLPDVGSALGKSIREFRRAATDVQDATSLETAPKPANQPDAAPPVVAPSTAPAPSAAPSPAPAPSPGTASSESTSDQA
jgi:sec-independent protein translocase protein TatA